MGGGVAGGGPAGHCVCSHYPHVTYRKLRGGSAVGSEPTVVTCDAAANNMRLKPVQQSQEASPNITHMRGGGVSALSRVYQSSCKHDQPQTARGLRVSWGGTGIGPGCLLDEVLGQTQDMLDFSIWAVYCVYYVFIAFIFKAIFKWSKLTGFII